jgi:putative Mg2+ transporter-C (MgtC) family protein
MGFENILGGLNTHSILIATGKLVLAALLGGLIGFERETHGQSAGFRTILLISLSSCLMMMISLHMEELFSRLGAESAVRLDPGRIASYTIAGMGFLGAGSIIKGRGTVRGITTATSMWLATGLGLAVGAGYIFPALLTTVISIVILYNLRFFKPSIVRDIYTIMTLRFHCREDQVDALRDILSAYKAVNIVFINYERDVTNKKTTYRIRLFSKADIPWRQISHQILDLPCLEHMTWEESDVP